MRYHGTMIVLALLFCAAATAGIIRTPQDKAFISGGMEAAAENIVPENDIFIDRTLSSLAGIIRVPEDHPSIQAAIDAAVNGDTVLVADSTYYENINFKGKSITVASYFFVDGDTNHINNTIINGSQPTDPNKGSVVSFTSGEDTTSMICGFTITGGTGTMYDATYRIGGGIYCKTSGARIIHNKIVSNTINHTADCDGGGIGYWPKINSSARYVIIEDNVVESNALISSNGQSYLNGGGIHIAKGRITGNTIRYNSVGGQPRFSGGGGIAVGCEDDANRTLVVISGNTITHNKVYAPGYDNYGGGWGGGVDVVFCNVHIINNTISYNEAGGNRGVGAGIRLWRSKNISVIKQNTISFNSVTTPGYAGGIELWQTQGVQVVGNRIEGNNATLVAGGIDESSCSGNLIKENLIKGNSGGQQGGGIWAINSIITNNIIVDNEARRGGGIFCYNDDPAKLTQIINNTITKNVADTAGGIAIYKSNTVVMNTICWGNTAPHGPEIEMWGGMLNTAYSDIQFGAEGIVIDSEAVVNWLAGNIVTDPAFADADYRLSENSFCLGAGAKYMNIFGILCPAPNTDFAGNARPSPALSNPDIGAWESPLDKPEGWLLVPDNFAGIQSAIDAALDGNVVLVQDSTYYENINFKGKAITVASYFYVDGDTNHINKTIINGSQPSHADSGSVVYFISGEDTTSVLCGFTITGGTGTALGQEPSRVGGGIFCYNSGARIINNKIIENTVNSSDRDVLGGGLAALPITSTAYVILQDNQISHNTLTVTADSKDVLGGGVELMGNGIIVNNLISYNSIVHNATARQAFSGGLECYSLPTNRRKVIVESNKITHNSVISKSNADVAAGSGGVEIYGSSGRFAKNEVSYNEIWVNSSKNAVGAGMSIHEAPASLIVMGNVIRENAVRQGNGLGGGVLIAINSSPIVINNIIKGNSATTGGGFLIATSTPQLINNTVINNLATSGGGINVRMSATVYLMNTILWGNQATNYAGIQLESGSITVTYSDVQGGWAGTGNLNEDPLFMDAKFHLADNSPCLDKGNPAAEYNDPDSSRNDMGAYGGPGEKPTSIKIERSENELPPNTFALFQNYPNPFNPRTVISYQLTVISEVELSVYNILGQKVATLISARQPAGSYKVEWDAAGFASGVYFYRLTTDQGFIETKKLVLLR